ncbi:MAG TPA: LmeA family phospholipid-binding protein [Trichocoleus sp.]|jgi:hypothetical protein
MQDKANLTEQAVNRFVEMALATQIKDADRIEVKLKFDLSRLMRGETDGIQIKIAGLLLSHNLRVTDLQLVMGRVAVKPLKAMRGKIILIQPVVGQLTIALNEQQLADAINADPCLESINQQWQAARVSPMDVSLQSIQCRFQAQGAIEFYGQLSSQMQLNSQLLEFTAVPFIDTEANQVGFQNISFQNDQTIEAADISALIELILKEVSEALRLKEFEQQAVFLTPQQLDLMPQLLRLQSAAHIEQFPSSPSN